MSGLPVEIVAFEKSSYIGGRSTTVDAYDDPSLPIELGASIFVGVNYNLVNATQELNLTVSSNSETARIAGDDKVDVLGVFNGQKLIFQVPEGKWWSLARIIFRYGPFAPWRTKKLTEATVGKFLNLYNAPYFPFKSLSQAVEDVGLLEATGNTGEQFLKANGIEGRFPSELIQASTRVNYGQNLGLIHGLETMVCMAAEGAMSIEGGNWKIFAGMLNASSTSTRISTTVTAITKNADNEWVVSWKPQGSRHATSEIFDSVIIAAPYQQTDIKVTPELEKTPDVIPYVTLHVTLFSSSLRLDPTVFGLAAGTKTPAVILTTLNATENADETVRRATGPASAGSAGFFSVSTLRTTERPEGKEYIYKVFSPSEFTDADINRIIGATEDTAVTWKLRKEWLSYPYEYPRVTFEESKLAENLWYTAGMESFISTMETNSLMGKNIAKLVVEEWEAEKAAADAKVVESHQIIEIEKPSTEESETVAAKEVEPETESAEPETAEPSSDEPAPESEKLESTPEPAEETPIPAPETSEDPVEESAETPSPTPLSDATPEEVTSEETTAEDPTAIEPETETHPKAEL